MKTFLTISALIQATAALLIGLSWAAQPEINLESYATPVLWIWGIANIPGICVCIPLFLLCAPGFIHADVFDGLPGWIAIIGVPTAVSIGIDLLWWKLLTKRSQLAGAISQ